MFPVSIKGVLLCTPDKAVLLRNERDEWELPGGRLEIGEDPVSCLKREFAEELSVSIGVSTLRDCYLFEVIPQRHVFIVTYGCLLDGAFSPEISAEHLQLGLFQLDQLPANLPGGYRNSILTWQRHVTR